MMPLGEMKVRRTLSSGRMALVTAPTPALALTRAERVSLVVVGLSFLAPFPTMEGRFMLATELAMAAFVWVAHPRVAQLTRPLALLLALAISPVTAFFAPFGDYSLLVSSLVYLKVCVFVLFVHSIVDRCRLIEDIDWLAKFVVLPVAIVLCTSAIVDRYTDSLFFLRWHERVTLEPNSGMYRLLQNTSEEYANRSQMSGLAPKTADIPPFALIGITAAYWLRQRRRLPLWVALGAQVLLATAAFSMPKRSAVLLFGVALLTFLATARRTADRRWKVGALILIIVCAGVANAFSPGPTAEEQLADNFAETGTQYSASLLRLLEKGSTDDRTSNISSEVVWLFENPRVLVLGTGWILTGGFWTRPHNSYVGVLVGGGLVSLVPLTAGCVWLFRRRRRGAATGPGTLISTVLLMSLAVELAMNGYLVSRLEYAASILTLWVAWSGVVHDAQAPAAGKTHRATADVQQMRPKYAQART